MAPPTSDAPADETSVPLIEKLLQTLIRTLENHNPKSRSDRSRSSSSISSSRVSLVDDDGTPPPVRASTTNPPANQREHSLDRIRQVKVEGVSEDGSFKHRIGRSPPYNNSRTRWVTQQEWENYKPVVLQSPLTFIEPHAVLYQLLRNKKWLGIQSPSLVAAYRKVNKRPQLARNQAGVIITEIDPFPTLFYHLEDIRSEINASGDNKAKLDFQALEFITKEFEDRWADARLENFEDGLCSYSTLWTLFKPGDLVIRKDELGNEWLFVLVHIKEFRDVRQAPEPPIDYMDFTTWGLYLGANDSLLYRKVFHFRLHPFHDRRKITSLPVYPLNHKGAEKESFLERIAARGRKWQKIMAAVPTCRMHDGLAMPERTRRNSDDVKRGEIDLSVIRKLKERVIIDEGSKREGLQTVLGTTRTGPPPPPPPPGARRGPPLPEYQDSAGDLDERKEYQWDNLPLDTVLTDEQAQLCPAIIGCESITSEYAYNVSVENLEPVKWNKEAIEHLVLDENKKDLLKGLVSQHSHRSKSSEFGDLIENKGKGLVILLYGPPGVGKTLTAESIGEWVGKPLIALSIGDLIVDESQLERRLLEEFERALSWDAILLLDEADVVLEARSFEDVRRNGIVSVFLRQLEYYQGVLFLTTNRISTMDVAFQSRIQVALEFTDLKPKSRSKIWRGLLESRRKSIYPDALEHILSKVDQLSSANLNGRQIRNVLNIAEGYAFNEFEKPGMMQFEHVQNAVKAALEFQRFFDKAREKTRTENSVWAPYGGGSESD